MEKFSQNNDFLYENSIIELKMDQKYAKFTPEDNYMCSDEEFCYHSSVMGALEKIIFIII
jgi:hypothetical protein